MGAIQISSGFFLLIVAMCFCILAAGCVQTSVKNGAGNQSTEPGTGLQISELLNLVSISSDQAPDVIRKFIGNSSTQFNYKQTTHQSYADIYEFSSDQGSFHVNSVTGRVQVASFYNPPTASTKEVTLDDAFTIAETYAKDKYPQLWESGNNKSVKNNVREKTDHGNDFDYNFGWQDEYTINDPTRSEPYVVAGPDSVGITVLPNGAIQSYAEWVVPLDPSLNLTPDISESLAWKKATEYFDSQGVKGIIQSSDTNSGLAVITDKNNVQHLTWHFKASNDKGYGGEIAIDAHDGTVVMYLPCF